MAFRRPRIAVVAITLSVLFLLWRLPGRHEHHSSHPSGDVVSKASDGQDILLNPVATFAPLPTGQSSASPRVQHDFKAESPSDRELRKGRLEQIKASAVHSWHGYRKFAWLQDELAPVSGLSKTTLYGWGATLVDSLDTLWLLGLKDEFEEGVQALSRIDFDKPAHLPINVFETTIRYLGGLLSAYDVSDGKYPALLEKAKEVGNMLYAAFDTPTHMPVVRWSKIGMEAAAGDTLVAELGSMTLEFTRLSQLTGDMKYYDAVQRIADCFEKQQSQTRLPGLFPNVVNARECWFGDGVAFSIGGSADSVYEYFPKEHQILRGATDQYKKLYLGSREPMKKYLLFRPVLPEPADILLAGTYKKYPTGREEFIPETQHLACFAGGMFALASRLFDIPDDLETARKLVDGCVWAYNATPTGVMPEQFRLVSCPLEDPGCKWDDATWAKEVLKYNSQEESPRDKTLSEETRSQKLAKLLRLPKGVPEITNRGYALRPEAIDSIFILYRITGDESLREAAWKMFENITRHTKTEFGYSSIDDVTRTETAKMDRMESFWMAETLKYFYLLFEDPAVVSLDDFVFNTEAHPFRLHKGL